MRETIPIHPGNWETLNEYLSEIETRVIDVKTHGAIGDGVADETVAFGRAITAALASSTAKTIYVPDGTYNFALSSPALNPGVGGITFVGESRQGTVLKFEGGFNQINTATEKHLFNNSPNGLGTDVNQAATKPIGFYNLTFKGTLDTNPGVDSLHAGGDALRLWHYPEIEIKGCWFDQMKVSGPRIFHAGRLLFTENWVTNTGIDGVYAIDTRHIVCTDNFFWRTGDDAIAFHVTDNWVNTSFTNFDKIREGIVIANNVLVNCGAIKALGGRSIVIHGNRCKLISGPGVWLGYYPGGTGAEAQYDIVVTDNVIEDSVDVSNTGVVSSTSAIQLDTITPRGTALTNGVIPGRYDSGSGAFIKPWDWYQVNQGDATQPVTPATRILIRGNSIGRTLPAVTAFSDFGYGTAIKTGVVYNGAVTTDKLRLTSGMLIGTNPGFGEMLVSDNVITHTQRGISFPAATANGQFANVRVAGNIITDYRDYGVVVTTSVFHVPIVIEDNIFGGDHYRENTNSSLNGSFLALASTPSGVNAGDVKGLTIRRNTFRNVCRMVASNNLTDLIIDGNIGECSTPVAAGFNVGNKGVGTVEVDNGYRYKIYDADPTSGTFGAYSSLMATHAGAQPSAGWYYQGWFVRKTNPTLVGGTHTQIGWVRLTTGTAHVANTDWAAVFGTNT